MPREEYLKIIADGLATLSQKVIYRNSINLYDINIISEDFYKKLLNLIFEWELINLNIEKKNTAAIDLADKHKKIAIQVTSTNNRDKIQYTIDKFIEKGLYHEYNELNILILTKKRDYTKDFDTKGEFPFTIEKNIMDYTDLLNHINRFETEKLKEIKIYIENELNIRDKLLTKYNLEWFKHKVEENIRNLGSRYSPEINVDLNMHKILDALEQNNVFKDKIKQKFGKFLCKLNKLLQDNILTTQLEHLIKTMEYIIDEPKSGGLITFDSLKNEILELINFITKNDFIFEDESVKKEITDLLESISSYVTTDDLKIAENPYILLTGEAGIGKSHFMAYHADRRLKQNKPSLLLLGQLFSSEENPIEQIKQQLNIKVNEDMDEFFSILNTHGEMRKERIVIFIDALNEGHGKKIWKNYMGGFVEKIKRYKWLTLVMSVRNIYEDEIIPSPLLENQKLIKINLKGFDDPDKAVLKFFDYFHIPLSLNNKLRYQIFNPLFLKIYCATYKYQNKNFESVEEIFNTYYKQVNDTLKNRISNYPKYMNLVDEALTIFIDMKIENKRKHLLYYDFLKGMKSKLSVAELSINILSELINEDVFTVINDTESNPILYLTFELLEDYLIAKEIIIKNKVAEYSSADQLNDFFSDKNPYFDWVKNDFSNAGVIAALIIQIPDLELENEGISLELFDWPDHVLKYNVDMDNAFYHSLLWRNPKKIPRMSYSYPINHCFLFAHENPQAFYDMWNTVLQVTLIKEHTYNANFLFEELSRFSLVEFNRNWVTYLNEDFHNKPIFIQLIKLAFRDNKNSLIDEESKLLLAMNLTWFLSSTNDYVRDLSTKSLITLLDNNINLLIRLLDKFRYVKDIYIHERLCCVAYGISLNSKRSEDIEQLAYYFIKNSYTTNFLMQYAIIYEYIQEIVNYAIYIGCIPHDRINTQYLFFNSEYYKVDEHEINSLRKLPFDESLDNIGPDGYYYDDLTYYHECQNTIINSIQSLYADASKNIDTPIIYFKISNQFDYIPEVDRENFCRMVIKEIFTMGYDYIRFGENDIEFLYRQYNTHIKSLAQKYEWIALNKILRIYTVQKKYILGLDNKRVKLTGLSQLFYFRDIDPTHFFFNGIEKHNDKFSNTFDLDNIEDFLKNPVQLLQKDYKNEKYFLIGEIRNYDPKQKIVSNLFLLDEDEINLINMKLKDGENFISRTSLEGIFVKELYWSKNYKCLIKNITQDDLDKKGVINTYLWDITDGATDDFIEFDFLSDFFIEELELNFNIQSFKYFHQDELVCFNIYENPSSSRFLLFKKRVIDEYLKTSGKRMTWVFTVTNSTNQTSYSILICYDGDEFQVKKFI